MITTSFHFPILNSRKHDSNQVKLTRKHAYNHIGKAEIQRKKYHAYTQQHKH